MNRSVAEDVAAVGRIPVVEKILQVVAKTTGMRFVALARVTDRTWTVCAVHDQIDFGLKPGGELVLESTICNEIRQHHKPVVFGHASKHPDFAAHPTPKLYGFESYISIPVFRRDGEFFGTLCAIDPEPAKLDDPGIVHTLELFADLIAAHLEADEQLSSSHEALQDAEEVAKLRDQFIAVLGHDLRNPLQLLSMYTDMLKSAPLDATWQQQIVDMRHGCDRMSELIRNILDFARGRLGDGIPVVLRTEPSLGKALARVVSEVQAVYPCSPIDVDLSISGPVTCDRDRIAQLLANVLINAVTHGASGQPIRVRAQGIDGRLDLSVSNEGRAIPQDRLVRLFEPFSRRAPDETAQGLGLGLYIAAQIAKAHRGTLEAQSSKESGTRFVFSMPMVDRLPMESM